MSGPIVYIDTSDVREGKLEQVKLEIQRLVAFLDANVPRAINYGVYLDPDGATMSVAQTHPDSGSLEFHMEVGGPAFRAFVDLLTLRSIDVYGAPSPRLMEMLERKAAMLGGAVVRVHALEAGFFRFPT